MGGDGENRRGGDAASKDVTASGTYPCPLVLIVFFVSPYPSSSPDPGCLRSAWRRHIALGVAMKHLAEVPFNC